MLVPETLTALTFSTMQQVNVALLLELALRIKMSLCLLVYGMYDN